MPLEEQAAAALAAKYGAPVSVSSGVGAFAFGMSETSLGLLIAAIGLAISIVVGVATIYYKRKADKRHARASDAAAAALKEAQKLEREEHEVKMALLKRQLNEPSGH